MEGTRLIHFMGDLVSKHVIWGTQEFEIHGLGSVASTWRRITLEEISVF